MLPNYGINASTILSVCINASLTQLASLLLMLPPTECYRPGLSPADELDAAAAGGSLCAAKLRHQRQHHSQRLHQRHHCPQALRAQSLVCLRRPSSRICAGVCVYGWVGEWVGGRVGGSVAGYLMHRSRLRPCQVAMCASVRVEAWSSKYDACYAVCAAPSCLDDVRSSYRCKYCRVEQSPSPASRLSAILPAACSLWTCRRQSHASRTSLPPHAVASPWCPRPDPTGLHRPCRWGTPTAPRRTAPCPQPSPPPAPPAAPCCPRAMASMSPAAWRPARCWWRTCCLCRAAAQTA